MSRDRRQSVESESPEKGAQKSAARLDSLMPEGPPKPDDFIPLFLKIVRRLREVHAAGLFHRELSPRNIRLNGETVEVDTCPPPPAQATLVIKDAKYTAPELFVSQATLDERDHICSDIYVLGFLFYEFLAGRAEMARQLAEFPELKTDLGWMRWHADPERRLQPVARAAPLCPKPLADLIERMLEKDAAKRIRTFEEVESAMAVVGVRLDRTQVIAIGGRPAGPPPPRKKRAGFGRRVLISAG